MIRLMLVLALIFPAHFDHLTEAENRIVRDYYNKNRLNCCSDADGASVKDPDWGVEDGKYWVFLQGERRYVHPDAVVEQPNPKNHALVWILWQNGVPHIKCFLPGHLT